VKTKTQLRKTVKQICDKDHRNTSVSTTKSQTPRYKLLYKSNQKRMPNVCVNGKTDEVIIFL